MRTVLGAALGAGAAFLGAGAALGAALRTAFAAGPFGASLTPSTTSGGGGGALSRMDLRYPGSDGVNVFALALPAFRKTETPATAPATASRLLIICIVLRSFSATACTGRAGAARALLAFAGALGTEMPNKAAFAVIIAAIVLSIGVLICPFATRVVKVRRADGDSYTILSLPERPPCGEERPVLMSWTSKKAENGRSNLKRKIRPSYTGSRGKTETGGMDTIFNIL